MWLHDPVMSHTCLSWSDYLTAWCCYESHMLVLISIWLCDAVTSHTCFSWSELSDCVMLLWVTRACPDLYLTVWCCYESHVLVLIWLSDCVMQLWDKRACSDRTISMRDAVLVKDPQFTLASITLGLLLLFQILQVVQCLTHYCS